MNSSIIDNFHCAVVAMSIMLHKNIVLLGSQAKSIYGLFNKLLPKCSAKGLCSVTKVHSDT